MKKKLLALIMSMTMMITGIVIPAGDGLTNVFAAETSGEQNTDQEKELVYGDKNTTLTRGEWIHNLVVVYDMTVEDGFYPDNYFSDLNKDYKYYKDMLLAEQYGVIDIEAGDELKPDDDLTREFAAQTLAFCMGYNPLEETEYTFSDTDACKYKGADQKAIDRKWFALSEGNFLPEQKVTTDEVKKMIQDAKDTLAQLKLDPDHQNTYQYKEDVIEIPEKTEVSVSEDHTVVITDCTETIEEGDRFVVYVNGVPSAYQAKTVQTEDNQTTIQTEEVPSDEIYEAVDAQGKIESDSIELSPAEGVEEKIEDETIETETVEQTEIKPSGMRLAGKKTAKKSILDGKKKIKNRTYSKKISVGDGITAVVNVTLNNPVVSWNFKGAYDYVQLEADTITDYHISCDATKTFETLKKVNGTKLINASIEGIGGFSVSIDIGAMGNLTGKLAGHLSTGIAVDRNGARTLREFKTTKNYVSIEARGFIGLKAELNIGNSFISGNCYARAGIAANLRSEIFNDGKAPNRCTSFVAYVYTDCGASASINIPMLGYKKSLREEYVIYDKNNSPIRIEHHYEDGRVVWDCTRNPGEWKYSTAADSPYWGSGWSGHDSANGFDAQGEPYAIYEYTLRENKYAEQEAVIIKYRGNMKDLYIPETLDGYTVVGIGDSAFKGAGMLSVHIPDTVTEIGSHAYRECKRLSSVKLSKNIKTIGYGAFLGCVNLSSIKIPKSIETCGVDYNYGIFTGCTNLKNVELEEGLTRIPDNILKDCPEIEEIEIPDTVTKIGSRAFENCVNLKSANIPDTITEIGSHAYRECKRLSSVKLSKNIKTIYYGAFLGCVNLSSIKIPKSIETCGGRFSNDDGIFTGCTNLKNVELEEGLTRIPDNILKDCPEIEEIEIPDTVTKIGSQAFENCVNLKLANIPDTITEIGNYAYRECKRLSSVKLSKNIKTIYYGAFLGCVNLSSIKIPKSIETCGGRFSNDDGIFTGCTNLKNVELEEGLTRIPDNILKDCPGIEEIKIPDMAKEIGSQAFDNCVNLKSVNIPDAATSIGDFVFEGCKNLSTVTLPKNRKSIERGMFSGCSNLKEITLPETVKYIRESAFENSGLTKITIPDRVTLIDTNAFKNNTALEEVTLGKSVTLIRGGAFYSCKALKNIHFPDKTALIGKEAFRKCETLSSIEIPDSVVSIGNYAFAENMALKDIKMGVNITKIPNYAFYEDPAIESVVIPGKVTEIGDNAFGHCTGLKEITIPKSVTKIADNAFSYPAKMKINGVAGSYAEEYASGKSISFNKVPDEEEPAPLEIPKWKVNDTLSAIQDGWGWDYDADGDNRIDGTMTAEQQYQASVNTGDFKNSGVVEYHLKCIETPEKEEQKYHLSAYIYDDSNNYISFSTEGKLWNGGSGRSRNTGENREINFDLHAGDYLSVKMTRDGSSYHMEVSKNGAVMLKLDAKESNLTGDIHTKAIAHFGDFQCVQEVDPAVIVTPLTEIKVKEDSGLTVTKGADSSKQLVGLKAGTNTVQDICTKFSNKSLVFVNQKGASLTSEDNIGTGTIISIMDGDKVVDSVTVVVLGDINGDGETGTQDITLMARSRVGTATLSDVQEKAGDVIKDSGMNTKDISRLLRVIAGKDRL